MRCLLSNFLLLIEIDTFTNHEVPSLRKTSHSTFNSNIKWSNAQNGFKEAVHRLTGLQIPRTIHWNSADSTEGESKLPCSMVCESCGTTHQNSVGGRLDVKLKGLRPVLDPLGRNAAGHNTWEIPPGSTRVKFEQSVEDEKAVT